MSGKDARRQVAWKCDCALHSVPLRWNDAGLKLPLAATEYLRRGKFRDSAVPRQLVSHLTCALGLVQRKLEEETVSDGR
jgi:hypothetical protein